MKMIFLDVDGVLNMFYDNLILTSTNGVVQGKWSENTGLKRKHIKQAIKILNTIKEV